MHFGLKPGVEDGIKARGRSKEKQTHPAVGQRERGEIQDTSNETIQERASHTE